MPLNQQDKDELAALGIIYVEAPPDSWVYKHPLVFIIPNQVADAESDGEQEPTMADEPPC